MKNFSVAQLELTERLVQNDLAGVLDNWETHRRLDEAYLNKLTERIHMLDKIREEQGERLVILNDADFELNT